MTVEQGAGIFISDPRLDSDTVIPVSFFNYDNLITHDLINFPCRNKDSIANRKKPQIFCSSNSS